MLEFKSRIGLFLLGIFCEFNNSNIELKQAKTGKGKAKFVQYLNPIQSKLSIKTSNEYKLDLEFHSKKSVVAVFSGEIVEQVTVVEIEIVWWVRLRLCGFSTFRVINELYSKTTQNKLSLFPNDCEMKFIVHQNTTEHRWAI